MRIRWFFPSGLTPKVHPIDEPGHTKRLTDTGPPRRRNRPRRTGFRSTQPLEVIMTHTRQLITIAAIAAASLLSAGAAFAQEATSDAWMQTASTKSRADVSAELVAARQAGLTKAWSAGYMEPVRSHALRATVRATTLQAVQSGELAAINAEVYSFTPRAMQGLAAR